MLIALLIGAGFFLRTVRDRQVRNDVQKSELDKIVIALREDRNRLVVYRIGGETTTVRRVQGGPFDMLPGAIKVRQPFSVDYSIEMGDVSFDDYIWDARTRTLIVRSPQPKHDPPNIDASRQVVVIQGPWITRAMQDSLRDSAALGAKKQASDEAEKPENIAAAERAARVAIVANIRRPLRAVGLGDITIVAAGSADDEQGGERWDVSRSIAQVLAKAH